MKKYFVLSLTFLLANTIFSQRCYIPLNDQSGFRKLYDIQTLETVACKLIDSLPESFETQFAVYDFGYFHLNEFVPSQYDIVWNNVKTNVNSENKYYLLIGRIVSNNANRIRIELKLPKTDEFDCVTDEQIAYLRHKIEYDANNNIGKSIIDLETKAINQVYEFIQEKKICCNTGNRTSCGQCIEESKYIEYLEENNFTVSSSSLLTSTNHIDTVGTVKEYVKLQFLDGASNFDVNQQIKDVVAQMQDFSDNIIAEIRLYDDVNCEKAFKMIENNPFSNLDESYFYIKVVGIKSLLGDKIAVKLETNINSGNGTGTLYILNGSNFELQKILDKTREFFQLTGLKIKVKPLLKGTRLGKTDGFAVIGKSKQKAVDLIFGTTSLNIDVGYYDDPQYFPNPACPECKPTEFLCKERDDFYYWPLSKGNLNPERSGFRGIAVDVSQITGNDHSSINYAYSNSNDDNQLRKVGGTYRSIAFLILHGTAHQAGFYHDIEPKGKAYCDSGREIAANLGCNNNCIFTTYEKLIALAKKDYKYMIGQTNARYGY